MTRLLHGQQLCSQFTLFDDHLISTEKIILKQGKANPLRPGEALRAAGV
jgi:hypothetical protein